MCMTEGQREAIFATTAPTLGFKLLLGQKLTLLITDKFNSLQSNIVEELKK